MLKICGTIIKNTKIVREEIVYSDIEQSYQENLKHCIREICEKMDIASPYWLPHNVKEYNKRKKTTFNEHNFMEELYFDRFVIAELKD